MIIAIDGPAASGKGTLAKRLAVAFGLPHLDTGLLYRGVAAAVLASGSSPDDTLAASTAARSLLLGDLDERHLRGKEIGAAASLVAIHPPVRLALLDLQRAFAHQPGGAVLDGRDIGTIICPDADAKIFVVASAEARAHRRHLELTGRGDDVTYAVVLADIRQRDERDSQRAAAPLKAAPDAAHLDTTSLDVEAAFAAALAAVHRQIGHEGRGRAAVSGGMG